MKVLILGLGNDLLSDDAIGLKVARAAQAQLAGEPAAPTADIEVRESSEMGLALLDEIAGADALVVIDAIRTGKAPPGHRHEMDTSRLGGLRGNSPHVLGVGDTLALGERLGLPMPRDVAILAIEVADTTTFGTELTSPVAMACGPAAARAIAIARAFSQPGRHTPEFRSAAAHIGG